MRADLQGTDGSALLVASPDEFRPFFSEEDAYRWLLPFAGDPTNVSTLRRALAEQLSPIFVGRLRDDEVLRQVARLIARACVAIDIHEIPWTIPSTEGAGDDPSEYEGPESLDEIAEEESEYEEVKPEPIIPPEFPRMAKREADQVDLSARKMGSLLDLLRFIGEKLTPLSAIAKALIGMANDHAGSVQSKAADLGGEVAELVGGGGGAPPASDVAATLKREAQSSADTVVDAAEGTGALIAGLLGGNTAKIDRSAVADAVQSEAGKQGRGIVSTASDVSKLVSTLLKPAELKDKDPSKVGEAFTEAARTQAEQLEDATEKAKDAVDAINIDKPEGEPPAPSGTGTTLVMEGAVAGEAVSDAAAEAAKALDGLAATPGAKPKPAKGWATIKLDVEPGIDLASVVVEVTIDGEKKLLRPDASGIVELEGVPEDGFDIAAMEDGLGLEVSEVVTEKAGAPPPPAPEESDPAPPEAAEDAEDTEEAAPERPLFPEEDAWLAHTNRIRGARGLSLKTREDIPPEITRKAEKRREQRARRKKKRS